MAPIRSFAVLLMVSSAAALNIHARQAVSSSAVVDSAPAATAQAVVPTSAAAPVVVDPTTSTPVVVPVVSSVVVPVATSAAVVVPIVFTSAAVIVPSVVPVSSTVVVAATTAAQVAVTRTSVRAVASLTPISINPTSSSAIASAAGAQSTGGASTLTANNVSALDETYGGVSKPVVIALCAAAAAIVCAALGIFLFRKYGVSPSEKFKHRLSDAGGSTAAFLHRRSLDNMEHGAASAAMIERPAFGRSLHSGATSTTPRSFTSTVARPVSISASNDEAQFSSPAPVRPTPKSLPRIPTTHETLQDVTAAESSRPTHPGAAYFSEYETVVVQHQPHQYAYQQHDERGYEYGTYHQK
ncbi:hypothetical protein HDU87_005810 [Geranomyces variabilis]|uniref:Transmembrane protein n=1 Tax=Geranomyces variabilis TaxID=109894 RepID=A0AAD5TG83_9FUNG|nr:hypothetical protein HDU87_005810 [Geranomyces variabilis]